MVEWGGGVGWMKRRRTDDVGGSFRQPAGLVWFGPGGSGVQPRLYLE